jgi:hypothetical protein
VTQKQNQEIVRGDPRYRRNLFTAYGLGLIFIIASSWFFLPRVGLLIRVGQPSRVLWVTETLGIGFLMIFIIPAVFLIATGRRIVSEKRIPHTRMRTLFDTPILRGNKATLRGYALIWLGGFCIAAILMGGAATHFLFYMFRTDPMFFLRHG